jgi:hypothetical protein
MEGDGFLTNILLDRDHGGVAGGMEDNFNIPITQGITSEGQQAHVEVQQVTTQRDPRGQKILIGRKTKLYALAG